MNNQHKNEDVTNPIEKCFVIAEAGVNHNGNLDLAKALVDAAATSGCDAVKFQTFQADALASKSVGRAVYQERSGEGSQHEMLKSLELPYEYHEPLRQYCDQVGIEFMSTAYDEKAAKFLYELGVKRIKIASADIINRPLLEAVIKTKLPAIMSTGMASMGEVERAVDLFEKNGDSCVWLMHCISSYPLDPDNVNMNWMAALRKTFNLPTGYSDHSMGIEMPIMAVSLGASLIEKHLTLDRNMDGPDQAASLEPMEFKELVRLIRNVESAKGHDRFGLANQELENIQPMRRSIHSAKDLSVGKIIASEDLAMLRPNSGIDPWNIHQVIGMKLTKELKPGEPLTWDILQN